MKPITERHVQAIWYDATLRPKNLTTRRGSEVRVISPGEWNLGAGPDFRNAVLEVGRDRRRIAGDVEIHLCPSDWDFHRHGADPNYRNVIAHVTWGCGPVPGSLPPGAISIWIGRFVASDTSFAPEQIDLMAYPYARLPLGMRPCEEWDRTGIRPRNTPERRLANAASVFTETPMMKMSAAADFSSAACRTLIKAMCGEGYIGRGRAAAVLANVILPFALAEERVASIPDWLPPEDLSEPVRLTAFRMFGRDHNPAAFYSTNGLLIQGLLQIHRDNCLQIHPDCEKCKFRCGPTRDKACGFRPEFPRRGA